MLKQSLAFLLFILILSCGQTSVEIDESTYEPKIVINGFLYPRQPISKIKITRNFAVGTTIIKSEISLADAQVVLEETASGRQINLQYNSDSAYFEYLNSDFQIEYSQSYKLYVSATVNGKDLQASSTTTVPGRGFSLDKDISVNGPIKYRERDQFGQLIYPTMTYQQAEQASFYIASIVAEEASVDSFIYENPFGFDLREELDNEDFKLEDLQYTARWSRSQNQGIGSAVLQLNWFQIWFYGRYRAIVYAADKNFFYFYSTHRNVQEADGNLHAPLFEIEGDGIGVFGSAITDTLYFNVIKNQ